MRVNLRKLKLNVTSLPSTKVMAHRYKAEISGGKKKSDLFQKSSHKQFVQTCGTFNINRRN